MDALVCGLSVIPQERPLEAPFSASQRRLSVQEHCRSFQVAINFSLLSSARPCVLPLFFPTFLLLSACYGILTFFHHHDTL